MKSSTKTIIATFLIVGAGVGIYFLTDWILKNQGKSDPKDTTGGDELNPNPTPITQATEPEVDETKWIEKGSKGIEVEKVQLIFNDIRYFTKKQLKKFYNGDLNLTDIDRLKQLSEIPYLKQDGIFGSETEAVCRIVMGSHGTKLKYARCKRRDIYLKYGGSNPYKGWNLKCD